jgi:hypothetical protein
MILGFFLIVRSNRKKGNNWHNLGGIRWSILT